MSGAGAVERVAIELTDEQRAAVMHEGGPLIVLAGPGTGKTRVIVARIARLIDAGAEPGSIVAMTFTNKAAAELRERLSLQVGSAAAEGVRASTFHSCGLGLVRRFAELLGLPASPRLIDSAQQKRLMRDICAERGLFGHARAAGIDAAIERARALIERLRHAGVEPEDARAFARAAVAAPAGDDDESRRLRAELELFGDAAELYQGVEAACLERGWMVFDDLLAWPTRLLREQALARSIVRGETRHVVVDEFQDVNIAQVRMLEQLAPPDRRPDLCVVGDDDQSIYGFRDADDRAFARFEAIWGEPRVVRLTENWRSEPSVIAAANVTIGLARSRFAPDKVIGPPRSRAGEPAGGIEVVRLEEQAQAGEAIAAMVLADHAEGLRVWSDYAVIVRSGSEMDRVRAALEVEGIPVAAQRDESPRLDEAVLDVLAWLELLVDPGAAWAGVRLLRRPPMALDAVAVGAWARAYRGQRSRVSLGERGARDPGSFPAWLAGQAVEDADVARRLARFSELFAELHDASQTEAADRVVERIVRQTGAAFADLADGRVRAARITALVSVLRFVRTRLDRLAQPQDVRAFLEYYHDLDAGERHFGVDAGERVEPEEGPRHADADGVQLLTAHASKGLEFEVVFVSGVAPPHGFPTSRADGRPELPEGLVDRVGDERSASERRADEERRLFYVACTRAARRLVLLARLPKRAGATNFLKELLDAGVVGVEREAADVIGALGATDELERLTFRAASRRRDVFDRSRRAVRLEAATALDRADAAGAEPAGPVGPEGPVRDVSDAARRLAVIAHVERRGVAPAWAEAAGLGAFAAELVARAAGAARGTGHAGFGALRGPLRLSYTQIRDYLRCPRCYYLKHVLELPEPEGAPIVVGTAVHEALEAFYRAWASADAEGAPTPGVDELVRLGRERYFAGWPRDREADRAQLMQVEAQLRLAWERFHDERDHIVEIERRFVIDYERGGQTHAIRGKIDRIDQLPSGSYRLVDWKTGAPRRALIDVSPKDLQMGLYAMALAGVVEGAGAESVCEYRLLSSGQAGRVLVGSLRTEQIREQIDGVIDGMLSGAFEPAAGCAGVCRSLGLG